MTCRVVLLTWAVLIPTPGRADETLFRRHVGPLLESRCLNCHGDKAPKAGLSLVDARRALTGGDNGPVIVPGKPDQSRLVQMISGAKPKMPRGGAPLSEGEVALVKKWIEKGAPWPEGLVLRASAEQGGLWWSLRSLQRPAIPSVRARVSNPIDSFLLHQLEKQGLTPVPEADRRTLIRRLYFDLLGLPPSPEAVQTFVADSHPDAYERLVDRLLASPQYGERWGRHWLDVAHYGDTHGFDKDKLRPNAWPYRDYVIRAFNDDRPYSRFVREQLAGDVLWPQSRDGIVATGFLAAGPWDFVGHVELREGTLDKKITRNLDRDDMVATVMNTFISLTVQCARCHDHKFDPIGQKEYYRLQAVFSAIDRADRPYDPDPETARKRNVLAESLKKLESDRQALLIRARGSTEPEMKKQHELAHLAQREKELKSSLASLPGPSLVYAAATHFTPMGAFTPTRGIPRPVHVLQRGNEKFPKEEVGPGTLECLPDLPGDLKLPAQHSEGQRRAALASWIVDPRNPLTWRSIVNRVWHYHFGVGLVDTPNDFGKMGGRPSHPELLDWLAVEFRDGGQSLKRLHRLIVTSQAYRRASTHDARNARVDAGNRLLWRMNRRRLSAEEVRDSVLAVAGKLSGRMYGRGFWAFGFQDDHSPRYRYEDHDPDDPASHRRSIYRFLVRSVPDPFLEVLDCADPSQVVEKRNETLTALQALALLNNKFMVRMAEHFATRVQSQSGSLEGRLQSAYRLALGREPSRDELNLLAGYARQHGLPNACRLILNLNEFAFVD